MSWLSELVRSAQFRLSYWRAARRSQIILSAGMPRSGSTWLFNAARLLLRGNGAPSSGWIEDWAELPGNRVTLLKVHDHDPFLARHARAILYSYRDIRDALASSKRKFGIEPTMAQAKKWLASDRRWRAQATFLLRYESMLADPVKTVHDLARALHVPNSDPDSVCRQLEKIDFQPARAAQRTYDRETLLHPGHITDGRHGTWHRWLSPALLTQIENECRDWLAENDYLLGSPGVRYSEPRGSEYLTPGLPRS